MAKATGHNKTSVFSQDDDDVLVRNGEVYWAGRIPQALENDGFTLYAQSIVRLMFPSVDLMNFSCK